MVKLETTGMMSTKERKEKVSKLEGEIDVICNQISKLEATLEKKNSELISLLRVVEWDKSQ